MREFVYGTQAQYDKLKDLLENGRCEVFRCTLPNSFSRPACRLGFEKNDVFYTVYIDKGITCSRSTTTDLLTEFLSNGEIKFIDFNDVKDFLNSMQPLFS